jgi:hypothetical protein
VLANLSGFDGSPESMRERQLEFGAEIGKAVVEFDAVHNVARALDVGSLDALMTAQELRPALCARLEGALDKDRADATSTR